MFLNNWKFITSSKLFYLYLLFFIVMSMKFLSILHINVQYKSVDNNLDESLQLINNRKFIPQNNSKYYVILSSSLNLWYMFPLPIVVLCWEKLGVKSVVIIIGSEKQLNETPTFAYIMKILKFLGTKIVFLPSKFSIVPETTLAQISRLYAAMSNSINFHDETILITADADMITFNLSQHIPRGREKLKIYNSRCCANFHLKKKRLRVRHFRINTIAAPMKIWKEIMEIENSTNGDHLSQMIEKEFGKKFFRASQRRKGTELWNADEILASYRIHKWMTKDRTNTLHVGEYYKKLKRIERNEWKKYNFSTTKFNNFDDAHLFYDSHLEKNWAMLYPLLKQIFPKDYNVLKFLKVYQKTVQNFNSYTSFSFWGVVKKVLNIF